MKRKKRSIKQIVAQSSPRLPKHEVEEIGDRVWKRLQTEMGKHDLSLRSLFGDGWNAPPLDQCDFEILSAVRVLGGQSTPAASCIPSRNGRDVPRSSLWRSTAWNRKDF